MRHVPGFLIAAMLMFLSAPAFAFCGFFVAGGDAKLFNDATQVVLLRHGKQTVLSMQNSYQGPPEDFALVVPVPQVLQEENVRTLAKDVFDKIDTMTAPRLVEYWEQDPCQPNVYPPGATRGGGRPALRKSAAAEGLEAEGLVTVEAEFSVGEYDIVVLSAKESTALETWLNAEKYKIPDGAAPYFRPYIESGQYFFVAKVNPKKVKFENGRAVLSPLRFHYESDAFQLPVRLGMINSSGQQDLIAYVLAKDGRYEAANYPNVYIPTNLEVNNAVRDDFGGFYRALFDRVTEENPKAVVTEYAWSTASCDPCPGPVLTPQEIMTLGADVVTPAVELLDDAPNVRPTGRRMGARPWSAAQGWTVTRLHMRYGRDGIGEDFVFQKGEPVAGGNEWPRNEDGSLSQTAKPAPMNTFQGRYIIRHEWAGKVECANPQYGRWGGPPSGGKEQVNANPSPNTRGGAPAAAKKVDLAALLKTPLIGMAQAQEAPPEPPPAEPTEAAPATNQAPAPPAEPAPVAQPAPKKSGCATVEGSGGTGGFLLALFAFTARRRRR